MARTAVLNFMSNVGADSWFHKLDPRTKVAFIAFFTTIPLLFTDYRFLLIYLVLVLPFWLTAHLDFGTLVGPFTGVSIFLFMLFFLTAVQGPSALEQVAGYHAYTWYVRFGPLVVTSHTFIWGLFVALRLVGPLTTGLLIVTTTDPTYLAKGLRKLGMAIPLVFMVLAGLRFIPIVVEQLFNIQDAMTIRGVKGSSFKRAQLLLLPLLITSLGRTRTMGYACETKGFGARRWNDFYESFELGRNDKILLIGLGLLTVASLMVRFVFGLGLMTVGYAY